MQTEEQKTGEAWERGYMRLMFKSEHQYFSTGKYLGGAMDGNGAIVPRAWVITHNLFHTLQAIKLEVGLEMKLQE